MSRNKQFDWNSASHDLGLEAIDLTRQLSIAMIEYGRSLWALQLDTAGKITAETSRQFKQWLHSTAENGDTLGQWSGLFSPRTQKFIEITQGWLDIASQATRDINELYGQVLATSLSAGEPGPASGYPHHERRTEAKVISFPDRRRATSAFRAAASRNTDETPRQRTGSA